MSLEMEKNGHIFEEYNEIGEKFDIDDKKNEEILVRTM